MGKLRWALILALLGLILAPGLARAGFRWCASDPVIKVDDTEITIVVSILERDKELVQGPVHVFVRVPRGAETSIVRTNGGFNGHGERVVFIPAGRQETVSVGVLVTTAGRERLPVNVKVSAGGYLAEAEGRTKRVVRVGGIPLS